MGLIINGTNYSGEVLEQLLTLAATGNELVDKGLIHIEPNVSEKFSIPRIKGGTVLQKHKEQPAESDSKGDFAYSEVVLMPQDFMAFTTFNPRSFEKIWRPFQPTGNLVFSLLTPQVQNALLAELAKCVKFELGNHFINGVYKDTGDGNLFNGIVTRIMSNNNRIKVSSSGLTTMIGKLGAVRDAIPVTLRSNTGLRILMSVGDFDLYDAELKAMSYKGASYTDMNPERFAGITIVPLAQWPSDLIVATICGTDYNTNLWAAVNLQNDMDVIQIDKLTNSGEKYFFKMLMKADTNIAFGEECIVLDARSGGGAVDSIVVNPNILTFPVAGGSQGVFVTATSAYTVGTVPAGFTAVQNEAGLLITAADNTAGSADKTGSIVLTLTADSSTATIKLYQPKA